MVSLISAVVIILLLGFPHHSMSYKWITLNPNDTIPIDAIKLKERTYVGRAVHYNLVLPAEVYSTTLAIIIYNDQKISKSQFEVLIATENCEWNKADIYEISRNVVLAGSAWNNEPIYVGKTADIKGEPHIASIFAESWRITPYLQINFALICDVKQQTWIETSSGNLPKNAVYGGVGNDYLVYFIGRLLGDSTWAVGNIIPKKNITIAEFDNFQMESLYSQVLVGDPKQYRWRVSKFGKIPDYAVFCEQKNRGEIKYIVKLDRVATQRAPSELRLLPSYEVLVCNE